MARYVAATFVDVAYVSYTGLWVLPAALFDCARGAESGAGCSVLALDCRFVMMEVQAVGRRAVGSGAGLLR